MESPLDSPEGNWWDETVNRRETLWIALSAGWALSLFGWMVGWTEFGDQNNVGQTYSITPEEFQGKASTFVATPQKRASLRNTLVVRTANASAHGCVLLARLGSSK